MIVWPSGGDFTTTSVPIVPEAPGRFSTKKGWSQRAWSLGASRRATMSGPAAGVTGIDPGSDLRLAYSYPDTGRLDRWFLGCVIRAGAGGLGLFGSNSQTSV